MHITENTDFPRQKPKHLQSAKANFEGFLEITEYQLNFYYFLRLESMIVALNILKLLSAKYNKYWE